jgi:hypothetical protein
MIRLTPHSDDEKERLALGFEAGDDLKAGDTYVDDSGEFVSAAKLDKLLRSVSKSQKVVVRIPVRYRLTSDPIQQELRRMVVAVPVIGTMTTEELGRVIHNAIRAVHDRLRQGPDTHRKRLPGE